MIFAGIMDNAPVLILLSYRLQSKFPFKTSAGAACIGACYVAGLTTAVQQSTGLNAAQMK